MNKATLAQTIAGIKTALPVSLDLVTDGRLLKTGNPFANAVKVVTVSGMIGMSYENGVNNALSREDKEMDFFAQEHPWMCRAENNLGKNKRKEDGKRYLPLKVQSASKPVYLHDGIDITDKVTAFIPKRTAPKTQANLDTKVIWRTVSLTSIQKIRFLGAEHTIKG